MLSFYPGRSGNIYYQMEPYILVDDEPTGTGHGTPWAYDQQVPLLFYGSRIAPGVRDPAAVAIWRRRCRRCSADGAGRSTGPGPRRSVEVKRGGVPLRFALNHMVAPRLGLVEFFGLAASLGIAEIEMRNDLDGGLHPGRHVTGGGADAAVGVGLAIISINALQRFDDGATARGRGGP